MWQKRMSFFLRCKPSRPKGARERNKEICRMVMGLTYDEDIRSNFVKAIKDKMADYSLEQIFLASPPNVRTDFGNSCFVITFFTRTNQSA